MIRIRVLLLLICLLSLQTNNAQLLINTGDFTMEWGERIRFRGHVQGVFDIQGSNFSVILDRPYFLNFFNNSNHSIRIKELQNLKVNNKKTVKLRGDGKRVKIQAVMDMGKNVYALSSRTKKARKEHFIYYHEFSHHEVLDRSEGKLIANYVSPIKSVGGNDIGVTSSKNKKLGAAYLKMPEDKKKYGSFEHILVDKEKGLIQQNLTLLPYEVNELEVEDQYLSNKGDYYLIARQYLKTNPEKSFSFRNRHFAHMTLLMLDGEEIKNIEINQADLFIHELALHQKNDSIIVATGFYKEAIGSSIRGIIYLKINENTNEIIERKKTPFTQEFLSNAEPGWVQKLLLGGDVPDESNFEFFEYTEFKRTTDGGFIAIAEHMHIDARSRGTFEAGNEMQRYDHYYHYGDILVYKLTKKGELEWVRRIPKKQESLNDGGYYLSFASIQGENSMYFFFNDHKKNYTEDGNYFDQADIKAMRTNRFTNVIAWVKVDEITGEVTRKSLPGKKELSTVFIPKISQVSDDGQQLILYSSQGNRHRFGRVQIN